MTTQRQDTSDRLARGYADSEPRARPRPPFLVDHRLERLLEIRDKDPATFLVFGPQTLATLAEYEAARAEAGYPGPSLGDDATAAGPASP